MAKAIHSMIRVLDPERSIAFYDLAFGLKVADRREFDDFALIYLSNEESDFELEMTHNKGRTEPYELGDGYGHLAMLVDDLESLHARLKEAGHAPREMKDFAPGGEVLGRFFFITDPDGYEIEVLQRGVGRFG